MNLTATMSGDGNETANLALDGKGYGTDDQFCAKTNYTEIDDSSMLNSMMLSYWNSFLLPDLDKFGRRRRRRNVGKRVGDVTFFIRVYANTAQAYISDKTP